MRFCVCVIKTLIDVGSELFKPLIDVGSEVVEAFVHGVKAFVDVGSEVVEALIDRIEAFSHSFEANIHGVLEPVDL